MCYIIRLQEPIHISLFLPLFFSPSLSSTTSHTSLHKPHSIPFPHSCISLWEIGGTEHLDGKREAKLVRNIVSVVVVVLVLLSRVWLLRLWTVAHQFPLSMEFSGKNNGAGCHFPLQGIFPTQGLSLPLLHCRRFFTTELYLGEMTLLWHTEPWHSHF